MNEKISALMDGEVDEREVQECIRELRSNPQQRVCWEQYHMIGDALRNSLPPSIDRNFVNSISQAIAKEEFPASVPSQSKPAIHTKKRRHAVANPWTGFALAASVAAVAYIGVGMVAIDEQAAGSRVASNTIAPVVSAPAAGFATVQGQQWNATPPAEAKLDLYLSSHRNVTGIQTMNTVVVPQARLVADKTAPGE